MSYQVHNFQTGDVIEAAPINEMDQQIQLNEQNIGGKADKVASATSGNFAALDSNGNLTDSGHKHSDYLTSHQDISGKADKVTGATNGDLAGLDSNGNLTDSGISPTMVSGKADKVSGATTGNFAWLDNEGNIADSGKSATDFIASTLKGVANGVAELDANGIIPTAQLPGYVDDVLEYSSVSAFPATGESGKIYVALDTNKTYRWGGTEYVEISASLALGETSSTAYRGDRGKAAYDHATDSGRLTTATIAGLYKVSVTTEGHVGSATEVQKSDITALGIPAQDTTYELATESVDGLMSASDKTKLNNAVTGITMNGSSQTKDGNGVVDLGTVLTQHQDISGKADKVSDATNGNFAALDANGNITDSGHKHSDYLTSHQDISGKADKVSGATSGNFAGLDANGNITDSGKSSSDFIESSLKGAANGIAELDSSGKVPTSQLPAYVDDVIDGYYYNNKFWEEDTHTTEIPGESGKIYVDLSTNKTYRWSGTTFVVIASDLALGETSSTAYRGDRGAAAYAAAVTNVESTPSSGSSNLITSGGVYSGLSGKIDKVASATNGHFAGLDSNGNLTDSGKSATDFIASTAKGAVNGVAELDANGLVPTSQLPSYVDDVLEYASTSAFPGTGETGKIYVALDTNKTYRWSGSEYVEISASLALGETSSTAYRGDRGATAYSHATDASRLTTAQESGLYKVAVTDEGHVAGASPVQKSDITALGIPSQDTTYENKPAASGGTDESLVTTGEKYTWNQKYAKPSGGIPATDLADSYVEEPSTAGTAGQVLTSDGQGGQSWQTPSSGVTDYDLLTSRPQIGGQTLTGNKSLSDLGIASETDLEGKLDEPAIAGTSGQVLTSDGQGGATWQTPSGGTVTDVQEDGVSILSSGVANILTMTGAGSSSAGTKGLVPAPSAGSQNKVLTGGGTWEESPGAKIFEVTGTITNESGSYSGTFLNEYVTAGMEPLRVYYGTPSVIRAKPNIVCGAGTVTFTCDEVVGTTTVSIKVQKIISDPLTLKSTEFDVLDNRLQNVENVYVDETITIATTDWNNGSYTWQSDLITANCGIELMETANSDDAEISYLGWTKTTGSITFTITETPADDLEIIVRIINAKANQLVSLTGGDISTDVITGADNVDEALGVLDDAITTNSDHIATLNSKLGTSCNTIAELKTAAANNIGKVTFVRASNSLMNSVFGRNRQGMFMCFDYETGYIEIIAWDTYAELYSCSLKKEDDTIEDRKTFNYTSY